MGNSRLGDRESVCVHRGTSPIEARLVMGLLQSEGIPARTTGEELVGAYPGVPRLCDVRVLVPAGYRAAAETVIGAYEARRAGTADWPCPDCGEDKLRKVFGSVGVVFKGSGFYRNDSRNERKRSGSTPGSSGGKPDAAAGSGDKKATPEKASDSGKGTAKASGSTAKKSAPAKS